MAKSDKKKMPTRAKPAEPDTQLKDRFTELLEELCLVRQPIEKYVEQLADWSDTIEIYMEAARDDLRRLEREP